MRKNFEHSWNQVVSKQHFWNNYHKPWWKSFLSKCSFLLLLLNKKIKNENTEYHGTFLPCKSQLYSKPGSPIFLLFDLWSLVLYLHVWVKAKFFRQFYPVNLNRRSTFQWKRLMDFMFLTELNSCVILKMIIEPLQLLKFLDIQATTKTRHDKNTQLKNLFLSPHCYIKLFHLQKS